MAERITFDRSLYLPEAVEAAAAAYSEHAKIELTTGGDAVVVELSEVVGADPVMVVSAFCNHVLYETVTRIRQAAVEEL